MKKKGKDLISILMPVFNAEKYLVESISSVLQQSFKNFEFIIINDGSTDNSLQIINRYIKKDDRIILIENAHQMGVVKSLNKGIETVQGNFVARIDADDIWFKDKLSKQINYLHKNKNICLLGSSVIPINKEGNIIKRNIFNNQIPLKGDRLIKQLFRKNVFCHSSIVFYTSILEEVGSYDNEFINSEDYELWFRILSRRNGAILKDQLVKYRITPEMISLRRRKEQIWYAIKAKFRGIKYMKKPIHYYCLIFGDLLDLLKPRFFSKLKQTF